MQLNHANPAINSAAIKFAIGLFDEQIYLREKSLVPGCNILAYRKGNKLWLAEKSNLASS